MNSGIDFSFEKPSTVYLGTKNETPSAFLPKHLSLNLEQLSCRLNVHLPTLACSWGFLQHRPHHLGFISVVLSPVSCLGRN